MKNTTKNILAAIPLVVGLSGQATAALSDSVDVGGQNGSAVSVDSLLNQFSGIAPGENFAVEGENPIISPSQRLTAFSGAGPAMGSYYNGSGSERIVSGPGSVANDGYERGGRESRTAATESASAPAITGLTTVAHLQGDSLSSVATGITPSSSSAASQAVVAQGDVVTPIVAPGADTTPVPLPAAALLLGSGLAVLAPVRKRKNTDLAPA